MKFTYSLASDMIHVLQNSVSSLYTSHKICFSCFSSCSKLLIRHFVVQISHLIFKSSMSQDSQSLLFSASSIIVLTGRKSILYYHHEIIKAGNVHAEMWPVFMLLISQFIRRPCYFRMCPLDRNIFFHLGSFDASLKLIFIS